MGISGLWGKIKKAKLILYFIELQPHGEQE